jgi:hypothetical protein
MSGVIKKSLASWIEEHGFGTLCIRSSRGEQFVIVSPDRSHAPCDIEDGLMSEGDARAYLAQIGFCVVEADEAIDLAREWATTVTSGDREENGRAPGA